MSKTIDQRVVEMQFDNRHFEKNTRETMSTLDKLKAKLNFKGASKGFDEINTSANKVNFKGMSSSLDNVSSRFSAMEVIGVTALANITNSAVEAGKRIVNALTIKPVTTGFQEYETQINATKTIMANVGHKGKTIEDVNKALEELNKYADQTIYNFTEMTRNIGLFTNAGVDLDTSVNAIKGFSNAAAMAGTDATRTAAAMYQLSQAMSAGSVKLRDWMSLEQANITGERFRDTLVLTAKAHGINVEKMIEANGSLRDTLKEGWLTADLMAEALNHYTLSTKTMTKAEQEANRERLRSIGYTEEQIDQLFKLGTEATAAATEVTGFTQMWGVLQETAQSGWSKTWKIIFGDLYQAKSIFTPLTNFFSGIIDKISEARNKFLESVLGQSFVKLGKTIQSITKPFEKASEVVNNVGDALKELDEKVTEVIRGNWGNGEARYKKLTEAGYNYYLIQNKVNETLGSSFRYSEKLAGSQLRLNQAQEEGNEVQKSTAKTKEEFLQQLTEMSKKELEAAGYTKEQIKALKELRKEANKTGLSVKEFVKLVDSGELTGRWLLINSFKNIGQGFTAVVTSMKTAWKEMIGELKPKFFYDLIAAFHKFTTKLVVSEETSKKLVRTFKGVFAILDMVLTLIGGPIKIAFKIITQFLQALDLIPHDFLGITATIGDLIVKFHDWFESIFDLSGLFKVLAPYIKSAAKAASDFINEINFLGPIKQFGKFLKDSVKAFMKWVEGIKEAEDIPKYIYEGLMNGLSKGFNGIVNFVVNIGTKILEAIRGVLGIHSPSTEFFEIGKNMMEGLFNGIKSFVGMIYDLITSVGGKLIDIIRSLDIGAIFTVLTGVGITYGVVKIANAFEALTTPLEGLDYLLKQTGKTVKAFKGVIKSVKWAIMGEALKSFAVAVAILAGSLVVLTLVDQNKLLVAAGVIGALMAVLIALTAVALKFQNKIGSGKDSLKLGAIALGVLGFAAAMWIMSRAVKNIASVDTDKAIQAIVGFGVMVASLAWIMSIISKKGSSIYKAGAAFMGIATSLLMMGIIIKIFGGMDEGKINKGIAVIVAFSAIIAGLMWATKLITGSKNVDKIGKTISKIAGALLMMAIVAKIAGSMKPEALIKGTLAIAAFSAIIVGLMWATKFITGSKNVDKIGKAIFGVAGALFIMIFAAKIASSMNPSDLKNGMLAVAAFGGIIVGLMAATKLLDERELAGVGRNMVLIAGAIGVLGLVAALLGMINPVNLAKGVIAVGFLSAMMVALMNATKNIPQKILGTLITMTVAIGVIALSVALLSMIDPGKLAAASTALGLVLGMFSIFIKSSAGITKAISGILSLALVLGIVGGALYLLAKLPVENTLGVAKSLSVLLLSLSASLIILGAVGALGPAAFIGIGALATLIVALVGLVVGIGALMEHVPTLQSFLSTGLNVLIQVAGGVGEMVGAFVKGAITQIASSLPAIGTSLSQFMENATPFINGVKSIDKSVISGITALVGAIMLITGTSFINSLMSWFTGGSPIDKFGEQLTSLATYLKDFAKELGTFDDGKLKTVSCAAKAIKALAEAAHEVPNVGGLWSVIAGENSLAAFGSQLPLVGLYLGWFVRNLGTFSDDQVKTVDCAGRAIKALAQAASEIPNDGGLAGFFAGENSILTFGAKLPFVGLCLSWFVKNLGTFSDDQVKTVKCAGNAIKSLAKAASEIPNEGGLAALFAGENDISKFGGKLPQLGTDLAEFVSELGTFSDDQVKTVTSACKAFNAITELGKIDIKDTGKGLTSFGKNLVKFPAKLKEFLTSMSEVTATSIESSIKKVQDLVTMATNVVAIDGKKLGNFGKSLKDIAKDGVKGFINEFTSKSTKSNAENAGEELASSAVKGIKNKKDDFKSAGKDLVQGLINGLKDSKKRKEVENAAISLGQLAVSGEMKGQKSNSPSKATEQAGRWLGEGLVIGIQKMGNRVYGAGESMGQEATNSISNALSTAMNLLNADMDTQPTIRPVLDLSDIRSGAGYLNSMFNSQSIGVTSNLSAISSGMNSRNQNGTNSDVVYAINKLRKELGNVGGDTYNVNGVTYDDGSNITDAVKTIVRAAKMERRT